MERPSDHDQSLEERLDKREARGYFKIQKRNYKKQEGEGDEMVNGNEHQSVIVVNWLWAEGRVTDVPRVLSLGWLHG